MTQLATTISRVRKLRGFTQAKLAQGVGITTQYVSLLETGRRTPSNDQLQKIAEVLDFPVAWLWCLATDPDTLETQEAQSLAENLRDLVMASIDAGAV